jgi:hypothetical protein
MGMPVVAHMSWELRLAMLLSQQGNVWQMLSVQRLGKLFSQVELLKV